MLLRICQVMCYCYVIVTCYFHCGVVLMYYVVAILLLCCCCCCHIAFMPSPALFCVIDYVVVDCSVTNLWHPITLVTHTCRVYLGL
jgi:hypothetical protein